MNSDELSKNEIPVFSALKIGFGALKNDFDTKKIHFDF